MPRHDTIIIHPHIIQEILEALVSLQYDGEIKIIDTGTSYTIRDTDDHFLTEIKTPEPYGKR